MRIVFACLLCLNSVYAQNLKPTEKYAQINLQITDLKNRPLSTKVTFTSIYSKTVFSFNTDKNGKAVFLLPNNDMYSISSDSSGTVFSYEIPDFPEMILDLPLQFDTSTKPDVNGNSYENKVNVFFYCIGKKADSKIIVTEEDDQLVANTESDTLDLFLTLNSKYTIKVDGYKINNNVVRIDSFSNESFYYIINTLQPKNLQLQRISNKTAPVVITYEDIFTKLPVSNQKIIVKSKKTKRVETATTDVAGKCLFFLHQNDEYQFDLAFAENIFTLAIDNSDNLKAFDYKVSYPSKEYIDARKKEDSTLIALRDIDYYKKYKKYEVFELQSVKSQNQDNAKSAKEALKNDSLYFQKTGNVVCAVLYRMKNLWKSKMIVTDLTGSMYPYMSQLTLWHFLKMMSKEDNDYVFFNDGDNKPDFSKVIGSTGGIYYTDSDSTDIILNLITKTMHNGNGGDAPENDIEALLYAQEKMKKYSEVILIADNYSNVKDIRLLDRLNVPVRVILCGTNQGINPDYVEIAYKTKGSIHTIEEDIFELGNLVDGNSINIGNTTFMYSKGKFYKISKS